MPVHDAAEAARSAEPGGGQAPTQDPAAAHDPAVGQTPGITPPPAAARRPGGLRGAFDALVGRVPRRLRLPLATYLACQAIFLFWWAAFYPGLMAFDSIVYILHVTTGPWVSDHSVLYDSLVWLSLHTTGDLGALTLGQTAAMSAAFAYTVAALRRLGVPGRWTAVAAVVVTALPPTGTFLIFVWKDVGFTICVYLVVPTVAHLVSLRGPTGWPMDRRVTKLIVAIGLELLGVCLFRPNGFLVVVIAAIVLLIVLPGLRARLAAVAVAAICVSFVLNLFVYPAVGIKRPSSSLVTGPAFADIAVAYADRPASFTATDKQLMTQVAPLSLWKSTATCFNSDLTTRMSGFKTALKLQGQFISLWERILQRSPDLILGARICRGSIAWRVFPGSSAASAFMYLSEIPPDLYGAITLKGVRNNPYRGDLVTRPLWHPLNVVAHFLRLLSQVPQLEWLLWRGATWCYVTYLAVGAFALRRRNRAALALAAVVVGQQLTVLADNPSQVFRYMASPLFIGMMLVPLFFARNRPAPPPPELTGPS